MDPLCKLHDGRGYDELVAHTVVLSDGEVSIRVLDLETLIEVKDSTNRPRDKLVVPLLIALRERQSDEE